MNQENYKAIAEIFRKRVGFSFLNITGNQNKEMFDKYVIQIINDLADYFEKEENRDRKEFAKCQDLKLSEVSSTFDRKEFLKSCGVE